jgi:hypothetical protein
MSPTPDGRMVHTYAMQGDTAKAKAAYQDFLTLWKDADPDQEASMELHAIESKQACNQVQRITPRVIFASQSHCPERFR